MGLNAYQRETLTRALERYAALPDEKKASVCHEFLPGEDPTSEEAIGKLSVMVQAVAALEEFALRVDFHWIIARLDTILANED